MAVLVYLCGDCHIEKYTDQYLKSLLAAAPSKNIHLLIQYDTAEGANRYLVRAGASGPEKQEVRRDVNTGDQSALEEFLEWGLKAVSAEHHVLVLSGLGINPRYVRQSLRLDTLPEQLQKVRGGKPGDPNEPKYSKEFTEKVSKLGAEELAKYRDAIHQRTFSICHDFSNSGSLEVTALRDALINSRQHFDEVKKDNRFELILMHAGATAFVEVLFELEGLARVYVGSSDRLPDEGLPFDRIIKNWDKATNEIEKKTDRLPVAQMLAESFLGTIRSIRKPANSTLDTLIAVNLDTLDEVARVLDALAVALLHSIGDWHVLDALHATVKSIGEHSINVAEPGAKRKLNTTTVLDDIEFVPAVDLFLLLTHLEEAFANKLDGVTEAASGDDGSQSVVPVAYSQRDRIQKLYKLIRKTLAHLNSKHLLADDSLDGSLLIGHESSTSGNKRRKGSKGLNILLPALRTAEQIAKETGKIYSLSTPSYSKLNFSRRVHWSALVGAVLMIHEKPHALWRVISSMLADASSPARDAVLSRLISKQSVVSQMRGQFRSLGDAESLTMSFDFLDSGDRDLANFQVRLEPSLGGSIVYQQTSRVYKSSLNSTWRNLQGLLDDSRPMEGLVTRLRALGASLGEDIIQDMIERLEIERTAIIKNGGEAPHLTLQMPREFMRYPWELMSDGKKMLCERYALGRQVFMESNSVRPPTRRASDLIRVLVIGDPAYTTEFKQEIAAKGWALAPLPSARIEAKSIERAFGQLNDEMAGVVAFEVKSMIGKTISTDDMRMYLRDGGFDLIHYAGHAFFNKEDPDGSAWVLSDGLLHAREIRNTLARSEQPPWLIFANACEAGMEDGRETAQPNDVTGLATACINYGVAAYIAPLWPVDDEIARWLAVGFYRELLRERYSVGESLRRSRMAIWDRLRESGVTMTMPAKTALTWSSFVLYGDPTSRLLQTLWTPTSAKNKKKAEIRPAAAVRGNGEVQNRFRSVTAGQLCSTIDLPSNLMLSSSDSTNIERGLFGSRGEPNKGMRIELVERDGLRFWRTVTSDAETRTRTFSPLGKILDPQNENEKSRRTRQSIGSHIGSERGLMDYVRVVKSWVVSKYNNTAGKSLVTDLAAEFDRQQVPDEQLSRVTSADEFRRVRPNTSKGKVPRSDDRGDWLEREKCLGQFDRALLVIHGTFSKCSPLIADFQQLLPPDRQHAEEESESLFNWMLRRYRAVLGFDHWTLSKSPMENAQLLLSQLPPSWKTTGREAPLEIDILCHSRGGLVARALTEKLKPKFKIRRVVMVGVPNAGTGLADPANWGVMADILVNQVSQDPTGLLGRLSSFLFYMLAQGVEQQVPGLQAMRPLSGTNRPDVNPFLSDLQMPNAKSGTEYFVVASNYVPDRNSLSLQTLLQEVGDEAIDRFFAVPNDLVVETASMWALDKKSSWTDKIQSLSPENILLFNTLRGGPKNLVPELQSGVHHTNYFLNRTVRDFIRKALER